MKGDLISLSVSRLLISYHRGGSGLEWRDGSDVPKINPIDFFLPGRSVLCLRDGTQVLRIGIKGEDALNFEFHERPESKVDLLLFANQIQDLLDALVIEGVPPAAFPVRTSPLREEPPPAKEQPEVDVMSKRVISLANYDRLALPKMQQVTTLFGAGAFLGFIVAAIWIVENEVHLRWIDTYREEAWESFFLGGALLVFALLAFAGLMRWMLSVLKEDTAKVEYHFEVENGGLRFCNARSGGVIARGKLSELATERCLLKVRKPDRVSASANVAQMLLGEYYRFPALQIQFPDDGPAVRITSKSVRYRGKDPEIRVVDESVIHYEVPREQWEFLVVALEMTG